MITALDHFVLVCPILEDAAQTYTDLLGFEPQWRSESEGTATAVFRVGNTALELMAPHGENEVADKLRAMTAGGPRLTTLVYRSDNLTDVHRVLKRRGLAPGDVSEGRSRHLKTDETRAWTRFRIPDEKMAGIKSFVLEPVDYETSTKQASDISSVSELDHIVINTPNPERAVANYAGRLGLRLALDRSNSDWGVRLLFFRVGNLTLEIANRLNETTDPSAPDDIWGLSWRVRDLSAAHTRLSDAGLNISEIRKGRRPGTKVFTVREGTLDIPTLFIGLQDD